ncbi:S53 family peptidase [Streptacidiphilus cavernicola]|uniref:Protease pro-enzyme activation domain-containing protein n=1 Tax=Streptacidiphilus cavernicola TaxID=3342716 RepID=A0ABV6W6A5_9ACTN
MSYPPYGENPQQPPHPQQPQNPNPYGRPQQPPPPGNPYGQQPPPPPGPYGRPQQPPPQNPNPYGRPQQPQQPPYPQQPNPYGRPQQPPPPQNPNPYGQPQYPPPQQPPYPQQPQYPQPGNPYGGQQQPPPPYGGAGRPPYGGPPQGPGGPGGPSGPGVGPGSPGGGGRRPRRSRKGLFVALGVVLAVIVAGTAYAMHGSGGSTPPVAGGGGTSNDGGTAWAPPVWATKANDIGPADPATVVTGTVYFAKASKEGAAAYAASVGTPGSPDYHHFLTPAEFHSKFASHANASQAVSQWVQQEGMKILSQDSESIQVSTTIAKVEQTLGIKIDRFKHGGKTDLSPTSQPRYPSDVGDYVASVTGLTTTSPVDQPPPPSVGKKKANAAKTATTLKPGSAVGPDTAVKPDTSSGQDCSSYYGEFPATGYPAAPGTGETPPMYLCGYTPSQLRSAYGVTASGLTGKGLTIAVVDAYSSPTIQSDLAAYDKAAGLPPVQLTVVEPSSYDAGSTATDAENWYGEETLDIEAVHTIAPDAKIVYYAARSTDNADLDNPLHTIVEQHSADIVTCSWGSPENAGDQNNFAAETQIFEQGAAEGISFDFSTGDDGDSTVGANPSSRPVVQSPADNPWVTAVGGTSLGIGAHGQYAWETGWGGKQFKLSGNSWDTSRAVFDGAAGGGNSGIFPQPDYQKGVVPDALAKVANPGQAGRELPDVAMLADPRTGFMIGMSQGTVSSHPSGDGVTFTVSGTSFGFVPVGGTSLASPLFAGMEALAAQAAGGDPLGYANPVLYKLYGSAQFRDILPKPQALGHDPYQVAPDQNGDPVLAVGDTDTSLRTTKGYDDVTGIGSPSPSFLTWFKDHPKGS